VHKEIKIKTRENTIVDKKSMCGTSSQLLDEQRSNFWLFARWLTAYIRIHSRSMVFFLVFP